VTLSHLILMRHGETDWNAQARLQGHRDIPLNSNGVRQAAAAAPSVAALGPQLIVSSDLARARDTANSVAELTGLPVGEDVRLRETSMGLWEGLIREDVLAGWPGEWERWRTTSAHNAPPLGESRWQVAGRAAAVVEEIDMMAVERALLVAHGGLIVGLTGPAGTGRRILGHPDRDRQLSLGGAAPDERVLAIAFLQRRPRRRDSARRRGRTCGRLSR